MTEFPDRVTLLFRHENPLPSVVADQLCGSQNCRFLESLYTKTLLAAATTCRSYNFTLRVQLCELQRGSRFDFSFAEPESSPAVDGCL